MVSWVPCSPADPAGAGSTRWVPAGSTGEAARALQATTKRCWQPSPPAAPLWGHPGGPRAAGMGHGQAKPVQCRQQVLQARGTQCPLGSSPITPGDGDAKPERGPASSGTSAPDQ